VRLSRPRNRYRLLLLLIVVMVSVAGVPAYASASNAETVKLASGAYETRFTGATIQTGTGDLGSGTDMPALTEKFNNENVLCSIWSSQPSRKCTYNGGRAGHTAYLGYGQGPTEPENTGKGSFRQLARFPLISEAEVGRYNKRAIPLGSQVLESQYSLASPRGETTNNSIPLGLYGLTTLYGTEEATWEKATNSQSWHSPGGDYNEQSDQIIPSSNLSAGWQPTKLIQEWVNGSSISPGRTNDGFILADAEASPKLENVLTFETEGTDFSPTLRVVWEPDTTPPTKPQGYIATFDTSTKVATVAWEASTDPPFKDGYPGSGVAKYSYRDKLGSGAWSSWTSTTAPSFTISSTTEGQSISVEAKAIDVAENISEVGSATVISKAPVQAPPASYKCRAATAENKIEAPAPPWEVSGKMPTAQEEALVNSAPQLCPSGQVAEPITTGTATAPRIPGVSATGQILPDVAAEGTNYFYTGDDWQKKTVGMEFGEEIAQPKVSSFANAHSLGQLAVANNPETVEKTVEMGWTVAPSLFSEDDPTSPHLFTYVNKDDYKSNGEAGGDCYDCHFVPRYEAKIVPGEVLGTTTYNLSMAVQYKNGNWWVWLGDQWIGYLNGDFWEGKYTSGQLETVYGEVYDNSSEPTSQMGNGNFGSSSLATTMTAPILFLSLNQYETTGLHKPPANEPTPQYYSIGDISPGRTIWHFGGPGS
jgi:hypothetical protein